MTSCDGYLILCTPNRLLLGVRLVLIIITMLYFGGKRERTKDEVILSLRSLFTSLFASSSHQEVSQNKRMMNDPWSKYNMKTSGLSSSYYKYHKVGDAYTVYDQT